LEIQEEKKYRLRVVNVGSLAGFTLSLPKSRIVPIQIDGGNKIKASDVSKAVGILYPGERVDLVVEWDQKLGAKELQLVVILDQE
jgi:hypothetical protein